ncbi:MAG TPA: transcriptional repressor [Prosthecobacter sp.]|nr:transcriptional repressor [Prosthecobacter sp.]HRK16247.1 transcriptional repressor [Prosthecobacter sp.]
MPPSTSRSIPKPTGLECRMAVLGTDVRLTPHRREVFEVLQGTNDHPTATDIFDRVKTRSPGISLATVYNCLDHLTSAGLIKQVHLERGQSRYCANLHEHVHFHCETCGKVIDAHPAAEFDPAKFWNLPKGTKIIRMDIAIHGTCEACASK